MLGANSFEVCHRIMSTRQIMSPVSKFLLLNVLITLSSAYFTDITEDMFQSDANHGQLAAFGDFDSDKLTDVFVLAHDLKTVTVYLASSETPYLLASSINFTCKGKSVVNVIPGDFDGDENLDVCVVYEKEDEEMLYAVCRWGTRSGYSKVISNEMKFKTQPFVIDYNADMLPDFTALDIDGKQMVWRASRERKFDQIPFSGASNEVNFVEANSGVFLDYDDDYSADILLPVTNDSENLLEVWLNKRGGFQHDKDIKYKFGEFDNAVIGQTIFFDLEQNGKLVPIVPVCLNDDDCSESAVFGYVNDDWIVLLDKDSLKQDSLQWGFVKPTLQDPLLSSSMMMHIGDYNLDGYPDLLCILEKKEGDHDKQVFLLHNTECEDKCKVSRHFSVKWDNAPLSNIKSPIAAAFYDVKENSIIDILVTSSENGKTQMHVLENTLTEDANFLKVLTVTGAGRVSGSTPYGSNQPGPMVCYETESYEGDFQKSCAAQLFASAHFATQLPYVIFGLGRTPNFVKKLTVGIPNSSNTSVSLKQDWKQIIPNSQIVIIPRPISRPKEWTEKLFLTPSHNILLTGITLASIWTLIACVTGFLHWRELKADRKEKLEEAQHFHFDAM